MICTCKPHTLAALKVHVLSHGLFGIGWLIWKYSWQEGHADDMGTARRAEKALTLHFLASTVV